MAEWTADLLDRIGKSDDLHIAPLRDDLITVGTPTWIWSVVVDGNLYVRAYNGKASRWYQSAMKNKTGRIEAAGETLDVSFESVSGPINDRIDDAYRAKYPDSEFLEPMIDDSVRAATVRIRMAG